LTDLSLSALSLLFKQQIPAHEVSCIVLEPVLGEGGYVPAPDGWLNALREVCDKEGILLGECAMTTTAVDDETTAVDVKTHTLPHTLPWCLLASQSLTKFSAVSEEQER
jgi:hypothetical protein